MKVGNSNPSDFNSAHLKSIENIDDIIKKIEHGNTDDVRDQNGQQENTNDVRDKPRFENTDDDRRQKTPRLNFTNVLRAGFMHADPKSAKRH